MDSSAQVPHLTTAQTGPLHKLERHLLDSQAVIENWLVEQWQKTPAPLYSSVDLRNAGCKLAPVDTNLYPAGFNNLNPSFMQLCVDAMRQAIEKIDKNAKKVLLLPESHTRSPFYAQSLSIVYDILSQAGFTVRIGSLLDDLKDGQDLPLPNGKVLRLESLQRSGNRLILNNFDPDLIVLNNDLSTGIPALLQGIEQPIAPPAELGWSRRLKSVHFNFYQQVADEFAALIDIDPWLINPYFRQCNDVDFMKNAGQECLIQQASELFSQIKQKYAQYQFTHPPFVVIKADAGTYGMGVMMVHDVDELRHLNRKERTRMSTAKGSQPINKVILQEGVYTFETWGEQQAVAEPVVYMLGGKVVGGFYRVHTQRGITENLNAPGMHFEPLAFVDNCNNPDSKKQPHDCPNRFYAYGVIARLATLAAARELAAL